MFEQLQRLYPTAYELEAAQASSDCVVVEVDGYRLAIPLADISESEQALLRLLNQAQPVSNYAYPVTQQQQQWQRFLAQQQSECPSSHAALCCIYLAVQAPTPHFEAELWQQTLSAALTSIEVVLPDEKANHWLVFVNHSSAIQDLTALLPALAVDFDCKLHACVGLWQKLDLDYPVVFQEEQTLAHRIMANGMQSEIVSLTEGLLQVLGRQVTHDNALMARLQSVLRQNHDFADTVRALFEHQGNLSQAAEALYIHRNTLTYRMTKYTRETGLNLQHLPDLIMSYLALEHKG